MKIDNYVFGARMITFLFGMIIIFALIFLLYIKNNLTGTFYYDQLDPGHFEEIQRNVITAGGNG